ncbi:hypothetical protein HYU92_04985 [Candidatus Curtissbacteria bacterium]|nr:hypothetical protein [Candidatus Curtissbacteria bacterium]
MKPSQAAKSAARLALDPFETINSQVIKPIGQDVMEQIGGSFWGAGGIGRRPQTLAQEELKRAREKEKLEELEIQDNQKSAESAKQITIAIQGEYRTFETKVSQNQQQLKSELIELQGEVTKLAKTAGVETKAHLQPTTQKVGILEIKLFTQIVKFLRIKAEDAKSAKELVSQRSNAKRTTGMLAWVSGKQMKVHEQGTLQLQG